ncbi:AAA family ATPase [Clostridium sp.]
MTKKLIFICGPNGVGKSSTCRELVNCLESSAYVESDSCSLRNPFIHTEGIDIGRQLMQFMLTKYLECSTYNNIIWSFGFHGHRKDSFDKIMIELRKLNVDFDFMPIILTCDLNENIKRMNYDNRDDVRIERAIGNTREIYNDYPFPTINTTNMTIKEAVSGMKKIIVNAQIIIDEKIL